MYPNLYYAFKDLFGVDLKFLHFINSFGFFVAFAFIGAAMVLTHELKRKEGQGLLQAEEETIVVGRIAGPAKTTIDAAGKIVCPGFVDPHTHYDAQITWDRVLSSSAEHGVTTVVMGNCGVGLAPCRPAHRDLLTDDLVTVEGIDKEVLVEGVNWDWETFPEYIDAAARRGSALNLAFLAIGARGQFSIDRMRGWKTWWGRAHE